MRTRKFQGLVPLFCLLVTFPSYSLAETNQGSIVSAVPGSQEEPASIRDGFGGAIIVWQDLRNGAEWNIYAHHVLANGQPDPTWPVRGVALCTAADNQINPVIASDGNGGAIVAWQDARAGSGRYDVYAQRVLSTGVVDPAWPINGRALCTAVFDQTIPAIAADGLGGAIVAWQDTRGNASDIYAQHVMANGAVDSAWPNDGRAICTLANDQVRPALLADGSGGALVAWLDFRPGGIGVYAQHVLAGGAIDGLWPTNGLVASTSSGLPLSLQSITDGSGGAILAWEDNRSGSYDVYASHVLAAGTTDPNWPANGLAVCTEVGGQTGVVLTTDGAGGAIAAWRDQRNGGSDIYAQRALSTGATDPSWPVNGRAVCVAGNEQYEPAIASDGTGGAFLSWRDDRNAVNSDIFIHHLLADGTTDVSWPDGGLGLCERPGWQLSIAIAVDDAGGAIVAWADSRRGPYDIYAQRVTAAGTLLFPDTDVPRLVSVRDTPGDQGGKVKLSWESSGADRDGSRVVQEYWVWRSVPPNVIAGISAASAADITQVVEDASPQSRGGVFVSESPLLAGYYWEFYSTQRAGELERYSLVCRTETDSLPSGNPFTIFFVQARSTDGSFVRSSLPDSGYSVDNLAPPTPGPFAATYGPNSNTLHWKGRAIADLFGYELHRGSTDGFVPSSASLITATHDTSFVDLPGAYYYKLAAADIHGNRSRYLSVSPDRPVAALASFLRADRTHGRLRIIWFSGGNAGLAANVYRRTETTDWQFMEGVYADGSGYLTFDDGSVEDHERYGYRLGVIEPGESEAMLAEAWVEPLSVAFAFGSRDPNPAIGGRITLTLFLPPSASAIIRLFDVTGRLVDEQDFEAGSGGDRVVEFGGGRLRPGVYLVNATIGAAQRNRRIVVLD